MTWGQSDAEALLDACRTIAQSADVLSLLGKTVNELGLVGEDANAKLLFLAACSRFLPKPLHVAMKAPSSAGKSFTIETVLELFREGEDFESMTSASPKALFYLESMKHKVLYLAEAKGADEKVNEELAYALRSLLSEGQLVYRSVSLDGGKPRGVALTVEGPMCLMVSTTRETLDPELETRILALRPDTTEAQTGSILDQLAREAEGKTTPALSIDLDVWHAFQKWLATGDHLVVVPFAASLAQQSATGALRMRRDFGKLLTLIRSSALIHRENRERDAGGRIVASLADYQAVYDLAAVAFAEAAGAAAPEHLRVTVVAVRERSGPAGLLEVRTSDVAATLGIRDSAARMRMYGAIDAGWLHRVKAKPLTVVPGLPLPEEGGGAFPSPEELSRCAAADAADEPATRGNGSGFQRNGPVAQDCAAADAPTSAAAQRSATEPLRREPEPERGVADEEPSSATAQRANGRGEPADEEDDWRQAAKTGWRGGLPETDEVL